MFHKTHGFGEMVEIDEGEAEEIVAAEPTDGRHLQDLLLLSRKTTAAVLGFRRRRRTDRPGGGGSSLLNGSDPNTISMVGTH